MYVTRLSPSSLKTYSHCEWQWFLKYEAKFQEDSGAAAVMGKIAHKALEIITLAKIQDGQHDDKETGIIYGINDPWESLFDQCHDFSKKEFQGEFDAKKLSKIKDSVGWVLDSKLSPLTSQPIAAEDRFEMPMAGPEWSADVKANGEIEYLVMNGVVDRIDNPEPGVYHIVDYKTGQLGFWPPRSDKKEKTIEDFYEDIQCLMYYYYARNKFPDAKSILVSFVFTVAKKVFTIALDDSDMKRMEGVVLGDFNKIMKNHSPTRNKGWHCRFCHFDKTNKCDSIWDEYNQFGLKFVKDIYYQLNYKPKT